ncbi:hypothetical protein [Aeromonas veronii]|uniref:hypothetical protein n=1 Tax=Aeromonas veronii TaxID=654 RepID=UPI002936EA74|nr:hypothetical protein [Aeromonas veronii]WOE83563.1 hypothetical protein RY930_16010 [Aeromonas veronii]
MKIKNYYSKLLWATFNFINSYMHFFKLSCESDKDIVPSVACDGELLFVFIDFKGFIERKKKIVNRSCSYECGRDGIDFLKEKIRDLRYDFLDVITDNDSSEKSVCVNETMEYPNEGTDIALIDNLSEVIGRYKYVFVVNSSASVSDLKNVNIVNLIERIRELETIEQEFIVGFNANSMISPRLPFTRNIYPHIITNAFVCKSTTILTQLRFANKRENKLLKFNFSNKFFCIAFFEVGLSHGVLTRGGNIYLLRDLDSCELQGYLNDKHQWPAFDTRISRYGSK